MSQVKKPLYDVPIFNPSNYQTVDKQGVEMAVPIKTNGVVWYGSDTFLKTGDNLTVDNSGNLNVYKDNSIYLNNGMTDIELSSASQLNSCIEVKRGTQAPAQIKWDELYGQFMGGYSTGIKPFAMLRDQGNPPYAIPSIADSGNTIYTDSSFVWTPTQRLGIGTNAPSAKLHVIQEGASDALRIDDQASDTTRFLIDQSGNVAVGVNATAVNKFSIFGDSVSSTQASSIPSNTSEATLYLRRLTSDTPTVAGSYYGASLFFGDNIGSNHLASGIAGVQTSTLATPDDDQYGLAFFCHAGTGSNSVIQETMRINHDGIVCINTTAPSSGCILDVNSTTRAIKIPSLTTSAKNAITTAGAICYDSTLGDLSFRNATQWVDILRNSMTQFKATGGTTTNLGVSANIYNKLATGSITTVGDSDFTTNSENFSVIRFNVANINGRRAKIVVNLSYSIDASSQNLSFGIFRNATYSSQVITVGTPLDVIQVTSPATAGHNDHVYSVVLTDVAQNDVISFACLNATSSGKVITVNNLTILAEINM